MAPSDSARTGVALIMVLLVLSALAIIGAPFVISMALQDKASLNFSGAIAARHAAEGARNHAIAQLSRTVYGAEWEEEARMLDAERPRGPILSQSGRSSPYSRGFDAPPRPQRRGMITRKDLGEKTQPRREERRGSSRLRGRGEDPSGDKENPGGKESLPETLRVSKKGPSPREFDLEDELEARPAGAVEVPVGGAGGAPAAPGKASATVRIRFEDPQGITAAAVIEDEQGKIHLNTAPPSLLGNLFGVSQLAHPLARGATSIVLDDASMFRGDSDPGTIDGALVIGDGVGEVVTYRRKLGDVLEDCFRGAYLSLPGQEVYPVGTFVRDLRGWKVAYHRLWARREGGFHPRELTRFASVESIREISSWQVASLFVTRFRGEGFGPEFLRENGVNPRKLTDLGLDPYIFTDRRGDAGLARKEALEDAKKELRRLRVSGALIQKLLDARGAAVVIDLAARLHGAGKEQVEKVRTDLEKSLSSDRRRAPRLLGRYLTQALEDLAEAYQTPGIETIEPEDLEWLRGSVTVHSHAAGEWSEAQGVLDDVAMQSPAPTARIGRSSDLNRGTVLRIRSLSDESSVEFNEAAATPGSGTQGGVTFAYPIDGTIKGHDGLIEGLLRHPVNINTASRRVLAAVFTGVRGHDSKEGVTPYEADQLALLVLKSRPFNGHEQFQKLLEDAVRARAIDGADVQPLLVNAVAPSHSSLSVSTTGFTYASGDVYTIESRGILRSPAALEIAHAAFREIVEVSAPRRLSLGLLTQADFADGVYLRDPYVGVGSFPENHHQYLLGFPGTRSHLLLTRPLLLHRAPLSFPGGDIGSLRLFPSETPEGSGRWTVGEVYHFRDTYEGLELAHGEAWSLPLSVNQTSGSNTPLPPALAPADGGAAGLAPDMDITMVPGGIEFWLRMRTYPDALSPDGHRILFDSGTEAERNRISLLYAAKLGRVLLRIHDASIRDVSVVRNLENGQYMEIAAQKGLELETWYHFRAVWDGVFGGGAQLFIDGFPAGTDNLSAELVSAIPIEGNVASISVKDASKFPREGVVRIDQELFEYTRLGNTLQVRRELPSSWVPLVKAPGSARGRRSIPEPEPEPPGRPNQANVLPQAAPPPGPGPVAPRPNSDLMRAPWNRRGSTPGAHATGSKVTLHGYSLEVRRKIRMPALLGGSVETQVPDNDSREIIWGQGGLRCAETLLTFNFPTGVVQIHHLDLDPGLIGAQSDFVVPLFHFGTGTGSVRGLFRDTLGAI
ncbi:MAG TPA: hypothetical protein VMT52_09075, partial [Planctomycetota bacterium]|nr:hypothetical protein [Planctomycetota bacterium]